ncbi:hypothetical protein SUGI_0829540 [Cryptomeria japonica]|nr:hypothetical protein SUGI_0829540 [Cryptomeria japonica]
MKLKFTYLYTNQQEEQEVNSPLHDEEPVYNEQVDINEEIHNMDVDDQNQRQHEDTFKASESNQQQSNLEELDDQAPEWLKERMKKKPVTVIDAARDLDALLARGKRNEEKKPKKYSRIVNDTSGSQKVQVAIPKYDKPRDQIIEEDYDIREIDIGPIIRDQVVEEFRGLTSNMEDRPYVL